MANADIYEFSDDESEFEGFTLEEINALQNDRGRQIDDSSDIEVSSVSDVGSDDSALFEYVNQEVEEPKWSKTNFQDIEVPIFREKQGPQLPENFDVLTATPLDYLELFLTNDALEMVLKNTNKYGKWKQDRGNADLPAWKKELVIDELKGFIGINVIMGLNKVPSYSCYWSRSPILGNQTIQKTMSKHRYEGISEYLHVSDREREGLPNTVEYDRLGKIRPLLDIVVPTFARYSFPKENQTIDEGKMLPIS